MYKYHFIVTFGAQYGHKALCNVIKVINLFLRLQQITANVNLNDAVHLLSWLRAVPCADK